MKKKIAFFSSHLGLGGIEKSAISYVNNIDKNKYEVFLFVQRKQGENLENVNSDVKIIEYGDSRYKNILFRKIDNLFKLIKFSLKYYHKFYFSAHFATSLKSGAILSKFFSKNNAIWFHGNYWETNEEGKKYLKYSRATKYKKVVFVSNKLKEKYLKLYSNTNQKLYVLNNPLDLVEIEKKRKEKIDIKKNKLTFLNVGRHEEKDKNIFMLLNCVRRLIDEGYDFNLWMVGKGKDTDSYKEKVKLLKLENIVTFFGPQGNAFPFFEKCDAVLLSSRREGNPVVFQEAKLFSKPIITTDVSDAKIDLEGYGIVTDNNEDAYLKGMKFFLDNGYVVEKHFDVQKYNQDIINKLYEIIEKR